MKESFFSPKLWDRIEGLRGYFPLDRPRAMVMMALRFIQEEEGYISDDAIEHLASALGVARIHVEELVGFYSLYRREKLPGVSVQVCMGLPCALRGSEGLQRCLEHFADKTMIHLGATECQSACTKAPVVLVDGHEVVPLKDQEAVVGFLLKCSEAKG